MKSIPPVRGTRDFYPEDMAYRQWLYGKLRKVSEAFGYQEYDGPFLERLELYAAKSGEELVKEQSFVFPDRGGEMIALRPELTPSLARMVASRSRALGRPIRWWSFGPFWRYEKPQKGRSREFFQWNLDLLGADTPEADAEVAAVAAEFFRAAALSANHVEILVNDRQLADAGLTAIGIPDELHSSVFKLIDRRDKVTPAAWASYAAEIGITPTQLARLREQLENIEAWQSSDNLVRFFEGLEALGVREYFRFDPNIIRGLDYYTGIVYEARDRTGEHRAILGGGRYDSLVADVGGDPLPAVGYAMGDVVIRLVLEDSGIVPRIKVNPAQVLVTCFEGVARDEILRLCADLRAHDLRVAWYPYADRLPRQLRYADRQGISVAVILGPEESETGTVTVKDLRTGDQRTVERSRAVEEIARLAGSS